MAEFQVVGANESHTVADESQDAESLQMAIDAIVNGKGALGSLAQLHPILDASHLTPSLVRLIMVTSASVTNM